MSIRAVRSNASPIHSMTAPSSVSARITPIAKPKPSASRCPNKCAPSRSAAISGAGKMWRRIGIALVLRSYVGVNGERRLYQEGSVAAMRPLPELFKLYGDREAASSRHRHVLRHARGPRRHRAGGEIRNGIGRSGAAPENHAQLPGANAARPGLGETMGYHKGHKEFHALDMEKGWHTPPGYPVGHSAKDHRRRTRRKGAARQSHPVSALRARRLYHRAVRARILGGSVPAVRAI